MSGLLVSWNRIQDRIPPTAARLFGVLFMVVALYTVLLTSNANARSSDTQQTIAENLGYFGLPTVGVGVLIVCGGIDLSIGSVVGLGAVCYGLMLERHIGPWTAALIILAGSAAIGLAHGLLVTKLRLQPFLVTLCGLFIYRGLAKWLSPDHSPGWHVEGVAALERIRAVRELFVGYTYGVPHQLVLMLLVALVLGLFLHGTRHGRYLFAIGANEEAARYAGIPTDRYKVLAYVLCSMLAGLSSIVFLFYYDSAQPSSAGSWLELYAITGAVLGGCSLSGGEGSILGMVLGAAVLPLLQQVCYSFNIKSELEYAVIGAALLLGTISDELLKRRASRRG